MPIGPLPFEGERHFSRTDEPAYLRKQLRGGASEGRSSGRAEGDRRRKIALAILCLGCLAVAGWSIVRFLLSDPRFFLASVELRGRKFASSSQVEDRFVSDRGRSLLRTPLEQRRREVEQIPWVHSATVARVFPNRIAVQVEERAPVAFLWTSEGVSLIDEEGVILDSPPHASFTFPVARGIAAQDSLAERRVKMQLFLALMKDLDRGDSRLREEVSEVDLSDPQDARAVVADGSGATLLHLGKENFLSRYLTYANHLGQWKQKFANIQSVDLRFEGQVIINADPPRKPPGQALPSQGGPTDRRSSGPQGVGGQGAGQPPRASASSAASQPTPQPSAETTHLPPSP
ncbi:MAG: hypothetical protein A3J28_09720 [Acidobacteria bacterium RIFCSPLOWO2_12_FULL_60_22]|nr:MAG: hypothetical protein A3J28_09720 [Acidobacteria bacterium RIFCSPLOWO2_12_FULL_60_22]